MNVTAPTSPLAPRAFSVWLDLFRWVAASIVMINHVGGQLLVSLSDVPADLRTIPHYGYSFVAGFAHSAVIVFFVMSGYLVGGSLCSAVAKGRENYGEYFAKRFTRLWIVLIPTLVLTLLLTWIGRDLGTTAYKAKQLESVDFGTMACNIVFLQNVACLRFGGNDSLWSLYNEFWYYATFPLMLLALRSGPAPRRLMAGGLCLGILGVLTLLQVSNAYIVPYMVIWLSGLWISYAREPRFMRGSWTALAVFVAYLVVIRVTLGPYIGAGRTLASFVVDLGTALLFCKVLINMKADRGLATPKWPDLHQAMAAFSYTLYCVHLPLAVFYSAVVQEMTGTGVDMIPSTVFEWVIVAGAIAFIVPSAYVMSLVFERNTDSVRRWFQRSLGMPSSALQAGKNAG